MKFFFVLSLVVFSIFLFTESAKAIKILPQATQGTSNQTDVGTPTGTGINISPVFRSDRRAVIIYFSNLQNAKAVSYSLRYRTNDQEEGAIGGLNLNGMLNTSSELLFGTCSKNVCRYHTNITNMVLEVSYTSTSNVTYLRSYKLTP